MANRHDYTSMGGSGGQFPQTEWTIMLDSRQQKDILTELCAKYWKPLYRYLRCKGFNNEEAKDLVQGFFTEKVIGREFFKRADRTKGKFRNFLLVSMRNYIINIQKKERMTDKNRGHTNNRFRFVLLYRECHIDHAGW